MLTRPQGPADMVPTGDIGDRSCRSNSARTAPGRPAICSGRAAQEGGSPMDVNKYSGQIWTGLAGLVVLFVLSMVFILLTNLIRPGHDSPLPLVAIGGVVVLVLLLTAV